MSLRVEIQDLRALGYCSRGCRQWFRDQGLDWGRFLREGIDAETIKQRGDALGIAAVERAEARQTSGADT